ncbi:MAG: sigma 54-interacting transcriptional regulator, partial [Desulfobacterales bacterium]|nr:sigma 54-interacting transcriptional regulator [Desulfobacterales bacterium]
AATNQDLDRLMQEGEFRQDLFFRISTHHIQVPPLRERSEDIPLLTAHFLDAAGRALERPAPEAPPELLQLLEIYHFPGNIRELRALIFDAVARHHAGPVLSMKSIRETIEIRRTAPLPEGPEKSGQNDLFRFRIQGRLPTLEEAEEALMAEAMRQAGNNQGIAATLLGISRTALNRRLNRRFPHLISPGH